VALCGDHAERNGEKIYQIFADSVTINQDPTDDLFHVASKKVTAFSRGSVSAFNIRSRDREGAVNLSSVRHARS
jgi:hypothetical protein